MSNCGESFGSRKAEEFLESNKRNSIRELIDREKVAEDKEGSPREKLIKFCQQDDLIIIIILRIIWLISVNLPFLDLRPPTRTPDSLPERAAIS